MLSWLQDAEARLLNLEGKSKTIKPRPSPVLVPSPDAPDVIL
jgi:hypothetical protein